MNLVIDFGFENTSSLPFPKLNNINCMQDNLRPNDHRITRFDTLNPTEIAKFIKTNQYLSI